MFKKTSVLTKNFTGKIINKIVNFYSYVYSRLSCKPLIYVIGDSHASVFKNKKLFIARHIGSATMHNLNKKNSSTKSNEKLFEIVGKINKKRDAAMFVFGEIDCRIHIYYQYEKQNKKFTIEELIDKTISNYGEILKRVRFMGIKFCIYGIPATGLQDNYYRYPFYGAPKTRSSIYREFNKRLKNFCEKNNYPFIDIYPKVSDDNGFMLKEFSADEVHLNDKIVSFARQLINKNGLKT